MMTRPLRGNDHTRASSLLVGIMTNIPSLGSYRSRIAPRNPHSRSPMVAPGTSSRGSTRKRPSRLSATSTESVIAASLLSICCLDRHLAVGAIDLRTSGTARKSYGHRRFRDSSAMARLLLDNIRPIYRTSVQQRSQSAYGSTNDRTVFDPHPAGCSMM